jgi:starch synthase (maltosyl-transferring)
MGEVRQKNPETVFLAEAFTRPRIMEWLAKIGFNQSYTYFTWRNTRHEIEQYMQELTRTEMRDYFRPNFWPNTPDILHEYLVKGGEPAHVIRLVLAATLSSSYGIYGPVYEFSINDPHPGKEEYTHNEKYEIKNWDWNKVTRVSEVIMFINRIRRDNPALQTPWNIEFCEGDNQQIISYLRWDDDFTNTILVVVNLDFTQVQSGYIKVPLWRLNLPHNLTFTAHDLLNNVRYSWEGEWNFVELYPQKMPVHVFALEFEDEPGVF